MLSGFLRTQEAVNLKLGVFRDPSILFLCFQIYLLSSVTVDWVNLFQHLNLRQSCLTIAFIAFDDFQSYTSSTAVKADSVVINTQTSL